MIFLSVRVQHRYAQESANGRLFKWLMQYYQKSVKPGSPTETTMVELRLSIICVERDRSDGRLKTYAWQYMVCRKVFFVDYVYCG